MYILPVFSRTIHLIFVASIVQIGRTFKDIHLFFFLSEISNASVGIFQVDGTNKKALLVRTIQC